MGLAQVFLNWKNLWEKFVTFNMFWVKFEANIWSLVPTVQTNIRSMMYNVHSGKYTIGLGQQGMGFCSDIEDICSLSLTAVHGLIERHGISYKDIGHLQVRLCLTLAIYRSDYVWHRPITGQIMFDSLTDNFLKLFLWGLNGTNLMRFNDNIIWYDQLFTTFYIILIFCEQTVTSNYYNILRWVQRRYWISLKV